MFPIRDDNPTLGRSTVTVAIVALNALAWVFVQGLGSEAALATSVCELGAIPGELLGRVARRPQVPLGPGMACTLDAQPELVHRPHAHVPARRLVPPDREHVVPLGVRRQRRGRDGRRALRRLLRAVRPGGVRRAGARESVEPHPDGGRLGRDRRRDGRLRAALPARARAPAGRLLRVREPHRGAGLPDARLLVPAPDRWAASPRSPRKAAASPSGHTSAASSPASLLVGVFSKPERVEAHRARRAASRLGDCARR